MNDAEFWKRYQHPEWQRRRLGIMARDNFCCQECGDKETTLDVHHKHYLKNRDPWDYEDVVLVTLCKPCHEAAEERKGRLRDVLVLMDGAADMDAIIGFCLGRILLKHSCDAEKGWVPATVKLESYEEGIGFASAVEHRTLWTSDKKDPVCEYLAKMDGLADSEDPKLRPLLSEALLHQQY